MLLVSAVNVSIVMNFIPFCIPLLNVKRLSPSLMKLFPGLTKQTIRNIHQQWPRNFLECCIMEMTKNYLNSTNAYSSPNNSYIVKN